MPTLDLEQLPIRFGRAAGRNDVVLDHPAVSAHHAEIVATGAGPRLRDLSSATGTRLNGLPVTGGVLADGDEVGIADRTSLVTDGTLVPMATERPSLELRQASYAAGGTLLLRPVDLTVQAGELLAVIGPSGSGKSTLLTMLAGLRRPTTGSVLIDGDDVAFRQQDVGYVPQEDIVHRLLTAREALTFAAELRLPEDTTADERDAAVARVLEIVGLTDVADRRVGRLSGGQRKRVAVALELISEPRLLLLDEPTTGLDPGLEQRIMRTVRDLARGRRSVVLVTHATANLHLCDRLAILRPGGVLAYLGPPGDAPAAFGVDRLDDVYVQLSDAPVDEAPAPAPAGGGAPEAPDPDASSVRRSVAPQTRTLVRRGATLMLRDRRNLATIVAQIVVLGIGAALLFRADVFAFDGSRYTHAGQSAQLLFLMVTIALWFGAMVSVRQVVGERQVIDRDLATGVRTEAYLAAKAIVLGAIATAQSVALAAVVFAYRPLDGQVGSAVGVTFVLVACALAGVALGLMVSAFARSEDQATSFVPLILLPQLLFGGAIVTTADLSTPVRWLSYLAAGQWGYAGAGHAAGMPERIAGDPSFADVSRYDPGFFARPVPACLTVLALMAAGCVCVLQARLSPMTERSWISRIQRRLRLDLRPEDG